LATRLTESARKLDLFERAQIEHLSSKIERQKADIEHLQAELLKAERLKLSYRSKLLAGHREFWANLKSLDDHLTLVPEATATFSSANANLIVQLDGIDDPHALTQKVSDLEAELDLIRRRNITLTPNSSPGDEARLQECDKTLKILKQQYRGIEEYIRNGAKLTKDDNQTRIRRLQRKRSALSKELHGIKSSIVSPSNPYERCDRLSLICTDLENKITSKERQISELRIRNDCGKRILNDLKSTAEETQRKIASCWDQMRSKSKAESRGNFQPADPNF
jgi:chromosome segregation ATPase